MKILPEEDFRKIITGSSENLNLEFKAGFDFETSIKERERVIRATLAMANTRNGGDIIIGINDEKSSNEKFEGVLDEYMQKFKSKVEDLKAQVEKYSSSPVSYEIYKSSLGDKNYILIRVSEFDYLPIVCKQTSPQGYDKKSVLEGGALYLRTLRDKPSSVKITDANDMTDLIRRAVAKEIQHRHSEKWLHEVEIEPNTGNKFAEERLTF